MKTRVGIPRFVVHTIVLLLPKLPRAVVLVPKKESHYNESVPGPGHPGVPGYPGTRVPGSPGFYPSHAES
eukprot:1252203-Rhodomonas_salina.3